MNEEQAIEILKKNGWCCTAQHPYSTFKDYQCGPRGQSESYGDFPEGYVLSIYGRGDTFIEAVESAVRYQRQKEAKELAAMVDADIDFQKHGL